MKEIRQIIIEQDKRFNEIQNEWIKHQTMNTCSVCDSPRGHIKIESYLHSRDKAILECLTNILIKKLEYMKKEEI